MEEEQQREYIITLAHQTSNNIITSKYFDDIFIQHEKLISAFYIKKPYLYKVIFKHFRFTIVLAILSFYFCKESARVDEIKSLIVKNLRITSANTFNSLMLQLSLTGRLQIYKNREAGGACLYKPTDTIVSECHELLLSMIKPYFDSLGRMDELRKREAHYLVADFFRGYMIYVRHNLTVTDIVPDIRLFLEKDAGHMIMLMLYKAYVFQQSHRLMISCKTIADYSHVSRSHVYTVLREAENYGFLRIENNLFITVSDSFITLFRRYFSAYMSLVLNALKLNATF